MPPWEEVNAIISLCKVFILSNVLRNYIVTYMLVDIMILQASLVSVHYIYHGNLQLIKQHPSAPKRVKSLWLLRMVNRLGVLGWLCNHTKKACSLWSKTALLIYRETI